MPALPVSGVARRHHRRVQSHDQRVQWLLFLPRASRRRRPLSTWSHHRPQICWLCCSSRKLQEDLIGYAVIGGGSDRAEALREPLACCTLSSKVRSEELLLFYTRFPWATIWA